MLLSLLFFRALGTARGALAVPAGSGVPATAALGTGPCCILPWLHEGVLVLLWAGYRVELTIIPMEDPAECARELLHDWIYRGAGK